MVCLALELVGPWVVLGFSAGMEAFDELLSINVPWSQEFSGVLRIWIFSCMAWRAIPGPLSKRKRRLDSTDATRGLQEIRVAYLH